MYIKNGSQTKCIYFLRHNLRPHTTSDNVRDRKRPIRRVPTISSRQIWKFVAGTLKTQLRDVHSSCFLVNSYQPIVWCLLEPKWIQCICSLTTDEDTPPPFLDMIAHDMLRDFSSRVVGLGLYVFGWRLFFAKSIKYLESVFQCSLRIRQVPQCRWSVRTTSR